MKQLVSEITYIEFKTPIDNLSIEAVLKEQYGDLIRWAIVDVLGDTLKIILTYKV